MSNWNSNGEGDATFNKQDMEDIFQSFASLFMQILMADNVFQTEKMNCGISSEWSFSVKLSQNRVNRMSILRSELVLDKS